MPQPGGSDFLAGSTFPLILVEKWILHLVIFQTLMGEVAEILNPENVPTPMEPSLKAYKLTES